MSHAVGSHSVIPVVQAQEGLSAETASDPPGGRTSAGTLASPAGISRRRALAAGLFVLVALGVLYVLVPRIAGLHDTWHRLATGDPWWLAGALGFELCSFAGYVVLFRWVFGRVAAGIGWASSWRIALAGVAASRVLAAGGAGGIVLTVWALRRAGASRRDVATHLTAFLVLLYAVYMAALVFGGVGLRSGLLDGPAPFALTLVPAIFAAVVVAVALLAARVPVDVERRLGRLSSAPGARGRVARSLARGGGVLGEGVRDAVRLLRTGDLALLGAVAWWAFDVAALWACLHAFGGSPPAGVVVMAYFVGTLGNLLPLPGGVGAVEGGAIGALVAFGTPAGLAIAGVLAYRAFSLWLPALAGVVAYVQLVRGGASPQRAVA
jgi:uncharacterized membrane protein YbhN (UPF0104 family)